MNAIPKTRLSIKAQHIGPIMKLGQSLSDRKQNLIFARNGMGKSFIARALRLLDQSAISSVDQSRIPDLLVSEEAPTGQGNFSLYEGDVCIGSFELDTNAKTVRLSQPQYIFHVFSEDYVNEQIRNKLEHLDGEITHQIIIGKENAELDEKENELSDKDKQFNEKKEAINKLFSETRQKHQADFAINASLGSFRQLNPDKFFEPSSFKSDKGAALLSNLLSQYNRFKSLPSNPRFPKSLEITDLGLNAEDLQATLSRIISPSSVANEFKQKIISDQIFFEKGLFLYKAKPTECPFCTQSMSEVALNAVTAYSDYFDDREAQERRKLNDDIAALDRAKSKVLGWKTDCLQAKSDFDDLKGYFPSFAQKAVVDPIFAIDELVKWLEDMKESVDKKSKDLAKLSEMPSGNLTNTADRILHVVNKNNVLFEELAKLIGNSGEERKQIQNSSCKAFEEHFFKENKVAIEEIRALTTNRSKLIADIALMKKTQGASVSARDRVVETFSMLLQRFFGDKYSFDGGTFKVRRNNKEMLRGGDRTLSDGEKSAMAFCYFLAQTHLRVQSNDEYEKIYFVFDDPVTSMSFDYVYSIIQCLKFLRISAEGEIQFSLESDLHKPKMLILTHNTYFFNVASMNRVVPSKGLYQLVSSSDCHELRSQGAFATPHLLQLKDVFDVSKGSKTADHTTPNSIRSVVESMWKFCRPDLQNFESFVRFLISDHNIEIKSVLINDLCHGGKFSDPPHNDEDIREAAKEAIAVVRKFAEGQIEDL